MKKFTEADLAQHLRSYRFRFGSEKDLQDDVEMALTEAGITFSREVPLAGDRIDFLCADGIGIECKIAGGPSVVLEQLLRYAKCPEVQALILLTSRHTHRFQATEIGGKPLIVVWVAGNL